MSKIILKAIWQTVQLITGFVIAIAGALHGDLTQFGVGFIFMSMPAIDRIEDKLNGGK